MKNSCFYFFLLFVISCSEKQPSELKTEIVAQSEDLKNTVSLVVLGTIQDAGSPQIACNKKCCIKLFENPNNDRQVVSLGLIDSKNNKTYLFEATPDIGSQMKKLNDYRKESSELVDGIFLTHAHIGHYTGLMFLGKEALDAKSTPIYVMPKMKSFLEKNGPWNQLIERKNIELFEIENENSVYLSESIQVKPILVPHRDEYSETVGYRIKGPNKSVLFIPDIDKWDKWDKNINDEIKRVDHAFLDATFYSGEELNNRDISEIPHPFMIESFEKFKRLSKQEKNKIVFIHFNHTNPVLDDNTEERQMVIEKGYKIAQVNQIFEL